MLLGICGEKNAGKSTVERIIKLSVHGPVKTIAFADPLKEMAITVGYPREILYGPSHLRDTYIHPRLGISARVFLQTIGEGIRQVNPHAWVNYAELCAPSGLIRLVSDIRHQEEFDGVVKAGGTVIGVRRSNPKGAVDPHPSEVGPRRLVPVCHHLIDNDQDIATLIEKVRSTLSACGIAAHTQPIEHLLA